MEDLSLGIHPRQQSARKQFVQQQVKYFYNSNIFAERPSQYDPSQFQKQTILITAKKLNKASSPPMSPKKSITSVASENLDIITGLPISIDRNYYEKWETSSRIQKGKINFETDCQEDGKTTIHPKGYANLYFENKKQYELWLKQNKEYQAINLPEQKLVQPTSQSKKLQENSYYKIHGRNSNNILQQT